MPSSATTSKAGAILWQGERGIFGEVLGAEIAGILGGLTQLTQDLNCSRAASI